MIKNCIIFDNENQSEEVEKMIRQAKLSHGITLTCKQFSVGSIENDEFLTDGNIDIDKVESEFKKLYGKGQEFHLAAFDWDLGDENVDGVELIRQLHGRKILQKTPKILYSGLLEQKLSGELDDFKNGNINKQPLLLKLKALIKIDIIDFVEREVYDERILNIIKQCDDSLDYLLEGELTKYPDMLFKNSFANAKLKDKTFAEILVIIDADDHLRNVFKKEIIEQTIAYLTKSYI
ncbi:hypothetical protein [Sphingobacterium daejeonense]|uniref:hypothetical protein n=1 Tax=Sphingobacterium daejeonense TaxID=371142 RepID=UPI003D31753D